MKVIPNKEILYITAEDESNLIRNIQYFEIVCNKYALFNWIIK